jgi:plastocyanin
MTPFKTRTSSLLIAGVLAIGLAACGGNGDTTDPPANGNGDAPSEVSITGTDDLKFVPTSLTAAAGTITVTMTSEEAVEHDFVIEEAGDVLVVHTDPGETASGTIDLEAGTYTFYCSIPGHRTAGMEGTLTVS